MSPRGWLLLLALVCAVSFALAQPLPSPAPPAPPPSTSPAPPPSTSPAPPPSTSPAASAPSASPSAGLAPLPGDQKVPARLLPPGAFDPDTGPSDVIYPAQPMTLRYNHKLHHFSQKMTCAACHPAATTSTASEDSLIPPGTLCDGCHATNHADLAKVTPGDGPSGQCAFCHVPLDGPREAPARAETEGTPFIRPFRVPRPNLVFSHKKHADRNIGCQKCHGEVQELELATRDQLPRMRGCFACHQMPDSAARGDAKSACETCHVRAGVKEGGRLRTVFATGKLVPPRWLHNAAHTADWISRHKMVAANDSQFCGNCHKEEFCTDCHDGRVRPRSIHPNDYISMHPIEARQAAQKCTSCHREQSFCLGCHQRLGVSMSGPPGVRDSVRFHPPKEIWSNAPRRPGHHAFEAERNLNACVSCHIERDCVICHGASGIGGGFNPHRSGFAGGCATQMRRNPRPCYVCHLPSDGALAQCR